MKLPPKPKKIAKKMRAHSDERTDNFYWLRDDERQNKDVINYLTKENEYTDYHLKRYSAL